MEDEAHMLYMSEKLINLLQKDQHALECPLDDLLELPDAHLQAWIIQFQVAIIKQNRIFIPETEIMLPTMAVVISKIN